MTAASEQEGPQQQKEIEVEVDYKAKYFELVGTLNRLMDMIQRTGLDLQVFAVNNRVQQKNG
jgi:hypothetical protein